MAYLHQLRAPQSPRLFIASSNSAPREQAFKHKDLWLKLHIQKAATINHGSVSGKEKRGCIWEIANAARWQGCTVLNCSQVQHGSGLELEPGEEVGREKRKRRERRRRERKVRRTYSSGMESWSCSSQAKITLESGNILCLHPASSPGACYRQATTL